MNCIVIEKCSCPKSITTNSYDYAPYSRYVKSGDQYGGIFFIILDRMIKECCGTCSRGHGASDIIWEKPADLKKKSMSKMKEQLEIGSFDLSFPIEGSKTSEYYRFVRKFFVAFGTDIQRNCLFALESK